MTAQPRTGPRTGLATKLSAMMTKKAATTMMLATLAVFGPAMAYAGITVIYPESTFTADVDETPPIVFAAGGDHASLEAAGLAGSFANVNNAGGFTLTLRGLSGGTVTVDDVLNVTAEATVDTFKFEIATALGGGIVPDTFKLRFYTGNVAPTADGDANVCGVLDLTAAVDTETTGTCNRSVDVQVIYALPDGQTTESDTVLIRPSSITFT